MKKLVLTLTLLAALFGPLPRPGRGGRAPLDP